jgi:hypothetical protein
MIKAIGKNQLATLVSDGGRLAILPAEGDVIDFTPIDGSFPDWRRVIPRSVKSDGPFRGSLDPALISRLWKAGAAIGSPRPFVALNSDNAPAIVRYRDDNALGLIMPIRASVEPLFVAPDWAHDSNLEIRAGRIPRLTGDDRRCAVGFGRDARKKG